ncbi:MAG: CobN component of cobalt chelatase involved in biosynthesis [Cyanobacteriota bacterium]|jgi:cobaltochelatase CobN
MHRLATLPGGWTPDTDGVVMVEQTPAPMIILTAADTDIQAIASALPHLPPQFPALRVCNLLNLQQAFSIDDYVEQVLSQARVIVLRLLGGRSYWSYGLEVVKELASQHPELCLFVLPGDDRPDPELISQSTVPLKAAHHLWQYFAQGGVTNVQQGLAWLSNYGFGTTFPFDPVQSVPKVGIYAPPNCSLTQSLMTSKRLMPPLKNT